MSLSPPYRERVAIPHHPTPSLGKGFHWPQPCVEVYGHSWKRIFQCTHKSCSLGWEFRADEMTAEGVFCHGDGAVEVYGEK